MFKYAEIMFILSHIAQKFEDKKPDWHFVECYEDLFEVEKYEN
jgi:hypothetical protein